MSLLNVVCVVYFLQVISDHLFIDSTLDSSELQRTDDEAPKQNVNGYKADLFDDGKYLIFHNPTYYVSALDNDNISSLMVLHKVHKVHKSIWFSEIIKNSLKI